jgi:hypothetical protein
MVTGAIVVRNLRILDSFVRSRQINERRLAIGLPRRSRRRRTVVHELPVHAGVSGHGFSDTG